MTSTKQTVKQTKRESELYSSMTADVDTGLETERWLDRLYL